MSHNVYRVAFLGTPRDHHVIFVETKVDGSGVIFQVRGDIQNGMTYEFKDGKKPEDSASFVSKTPIGKVSLADVPRIDPICKRIPPPPKQFNGPKRINPSIPLRRCQEWTQEAVQALQNEGILK